MPSAGDMALIPPTSVGLELTVPGDTKALSTVDAAEIAKTTGMIRLSCALVKDLQKLGVDVKQAGLVATDQGVAFASKAIALKCLTELSAKMEGASEGSLHEIANSVSRLAKGINALAAKNFGPVEDKPDKPERPRQTFVPGGAVHFHKHEHIHQGTKGDEPGN